MSDNWESQGWGGSSEKRPQAPSESPRSPFDAQAARSTPSARRATDASFGGARGGAKKAGEVKVLLWGAPDQGKTAYLWALGQQFTERLYGGLEFTAKRPSFQEHWTRLDRSMREGWERTADTSIVGGVLDLFGVCRQGVFGKFFGRIHLEVTSMDIAGELIREVGRFKTDSTSAPELIGAVRQQIAEASACFIIVRADQMLQDSRQRASSAMMIRQSMPLLQPGHTRTAIILTACDGISDPDWRERLGFGGPGSGKNLSDRQSAARDFLFQCDPLILDALQKHADVKVFPVSAWGYGGEIHGETRTVGAAKPQYVEDPLVWVLEREFQRHEAMRSRRRRKAALWAASLVSGLAAAASHAVVAPYVAAIGGVRGPLDHVASRLANLPTWVMSVDRSGMEPALYAEAVASAQDGRFADAVASMAVLSKIGDGSYFRSRAALEVARVRLDKQIAALSTSDDVVKADQRREYLSSQRSSVDLSSDRYAKVVMDYRFLMAVALQARQPSDAPTSEVVEALAKNKVLAVQHGGDLGRLLFAGWHAGLLGEPERFGGALSGLESLRRLVPSDSWAEIAGDALKVLVADSIDALGAGDERAMLSLIRWNGGKAEFQKSVADACQQELETRFEASTGSRELRDCFADACVESADLSSALQGLQLYVVDSLVDRRDDKGLQQLRSASVPNVSSKPSLQMAVADWASMLPSALFQPIKSMDRLLLAYATDSGSRNGDEAADRLARFEFVAGLFCKRAPAVKAHVSILEAQAAMSLALRPGFLEKIHPVRVRWVTRKAIHKEVSVDRQAVESLAQSVADRAVEMPLASLAVIVEELITSLGHAEFESADYAAGLRGLASALVRQNVDSSFTNTSNSLMQVVVCWRVASPGTSERRNFQVAALGIVNNLAQTEQWDPLASDALSRLLPDAEDRDAFLASVERREFLAGHLADAFRAHLIAGRPEMAAAAFRSAHALDASGLASQLSPEGKSGLFFSAGMMATLPASLGALAGVPSDRAALLAMVSADVEMLASKPALEATGTLLFSLSRLLMQDDASVADLDTTARAALQEMELVRALRACARGNAVEAEESLGASARWQALGQDVVSNAVGKIGMPIDAVLSGLFGLESTISSEAKARLQACNALIVAVVQQGGFVESGDRLAAALERLAARPVSRPVRSVPLFSVVEASCLAAAKSGQWDLLMSLWQIATRLSRGGWITDSAWPAASSDIALALLGSSELLKADGWGIPIADASLRKALKSSDLDLAGVWLLRERLGVGACCLLAREPAQIPCDFEAELTRLRASAAGSVSRRAALDLTAAMLLLEDSSEASLAGIARIREGVAALLAMDLQHDMPLGWESELFDSLKAKQLPPIARPLASLMKVPSRRDSKLALVNLVTLACSGREDSAVLFGPTMELVLAGRPASSLTDAMSLANKARSLGELPADICAAMTAWMGKACEASVDSWKRADTARASMKQLVDLVEAFDTLCARSQSPRWSRELQDRISSRMAVVFRGVGREMWDLAEEMFVSRPALMASLAAIRVDLSIRGGDLASARSAAERLDDGPVSLHMRSFLADCASMNRVLIGSERVVYLARSEVTVGEYAEFTKALRSDPDLLPRLAGDVGMRLSSNPSVELEKLMPGETTAELSDPAMPVHKINWWGARLYAAWRGHELPTVEALGAAWGDDAYPWGPQWDPNLTNTSERYASGQSVVLMKAPSFVTAQAPTGSEFHALHGNVAEFCSDASASGEVVLFGASAWSRGQSVKNGVFTRVETRQGARSERIAGYGFRTMLQIPDSWGVDK